MALTVVAATSSAAAQSDVPVPYVPPGSNVPATTPLGRGLAGAANAIEGARASDPRAAQRADALYVRAQQQAAAGDVSGALATTSLARAAALSAASGYGLPPAASPAFPTTARPPTVPLAAAGALLPTDLLLARAEIERVAGAKHDSSLDLAKKHYRHALDAWLSGNAPLASREASVARAVAEFSETKGP